MTQETARKILERYITYECLDESYDTIELPIVDAAIIYCDKTYTFKYLLCVAYNLKEIL